MNLSLSERHLKFYLVLNLALRALSSLYLTRYCHHFTYVDTNAIEMLLHRNIFDI